MSPHCWPAFSVWPRTAFPAFPLLTSPLSPAATPVCPYIVCWALSFVFAHSFSSHATPAPTQYLANPHSGFSSHVAPSVLAVHPYSPHSMPITALIMLCCNYQWALLCPICLELLRPGTHSSLLVVHPPAPKTLWNHGGGQYAICWRNKVYCILQRWSQATPHILLVGSLPGLTACKPRPAEHCSAVGIHWSLREASRVPCWRVCSHITVWWRWAKTTRGSGQL